MSDFPACFVCIPTFQDVQVVAAAVWGAPELFMILELETHWVVIIKIGQTPDLFLGQTSQFTGPQIELETNLRKVWIFSFTEKLSHRLKNNKGQAAG